MSEAVRKYQELEQKHTGQRRRISWIESRMMQAATVEEFEQYNTMMTAAEQELESMTYDLIRARRDAAAIGYTA